MGDPGRRLLLSCASLGSGLDTMRNAMTLDLPLTPLAENLAAIQPLAAAVQFWGGKRQDLTHIRLIATYAGCSRLRCFSSLKIEYSKILRPQSKKCRSSAARDVALP